MNKLPPLSYRLMVLALSPLLLGYTLWRSIKDGGATYLAQRLGFNYPGSLHSADLWVHAASVGEVTTVLPLLDLLLAASDQRINSIVLTTNTPTAKHVLEKRGNAAITHAYLPLDFAFSCSRFCSGLNAQQGWIVETEIWPRLYATCHQHDIALTIINARLSDKTLAHARGILNKSYKNALRDVRVLARSPADHDHYISIGADPNKVATIGNLKYLKNHQQEESTPLLSGDYVLAASTHEDEELQLAREWLKDASLPLLVIVPRHPERALGIMQSLTKDTQSRIGRRSLGELPESSDQLYLADTLGELPDWYCSAKAAFVGGSLIKRGGHNMLEAARLGIPVIVGPHTDNFVDVMQEMLQHDAVSIARDAVSLTAMLKSAADKQPPYIARSRNALALAASLEGVGDLYLQALATRT